MVLAARRLAEVGDRGADPVREERLVEERPRGDAPVLPPLAKDCDGDEVEGARFVALELVLRGDLADEVFEQQKGLLVEEKGLHARRVLPRVVRPIVEEARAAHQVEEEGVGVLHLSLIHI